MKPLLILLGTFILSVAAIRIFTGELNLMLSARIAMSFTLIFTAVGHFIYSKGMALMMPDFIPFKKPLVFFTGIIEIVASVGLELPPFQKLTGWLLILFFVLILPANIHAALKTH